MEAWRARVAANLQEMQEGDQLEDNIFTSFLDEVRDDSTLEPTVQVGGSRPGRHGNLEREREEGHARMFSDYFSETPVYGPLHFRWRFRMRRPLFLWIMSRVCARDRYFLQKRDGAGKLGLSSIQKCTAAICILAYGVAADATDEYCRIAESIAMEAMKRFCIAIREEFGEEHLRQPTRADIEKQLGINAQCGWPGMFGSIDCMHYVWKNCPIAWQGDYGNKDGDRSIILEAIADQGLHIWHVFFGLPGGNNDLNVLDRSPVIQNMLSGESWDTHFVVNGILYNRYYLLADGIYPQWSCFVQTIHAPDDEKRRYFAQQQESARKDVERCFGVLQARFAIVKNPCRQWSPKCIEDIMYACCILHNMILEDEEDAGLDFPFPLDDVVPVCRDLEYEDLVFGTVSIENAESHYSLRGDLVEHLWALKGARVEN